MAAPIVTLVRFIPGILAFDLSDLPCTIGPHRHAAACSVLE